MKMLRLVMLPSILTLVAASTMPTAPRPQEAIARKSIFSRDRRSYVAPSRPVVTAPAPPMSPVLTGIIREESGAIAAVLEVPGGRPVLLHTGDKLPGDRGTITEMNLDCFVFVPASGTGDAAAARKVFVGRNLDGSESTLVPSTTGPSEAPIEGDDIVSRMRRRRQQEGK
jgi:hypothetical protein